VISPSSRLVELAQVLPVIHHHALRPSRRSRGEHHLGHVVAADLAHARVDCVRIQRCPGPQEGFERVVGGRVRVEAHDELEPGKLASEAGERSRVVRIQELSLGEDRACAAAFEDVPDLASLEARVHGHHGSTGADDSDCADQPLVAVGSPDRDGPVALP